MKLTSLCTQFATCAALTLAAAAAHADVYNFSLVGAATASWQLASSPTPTTFAPAEFKMSGVAGMLNGTATTMDLFFETSNGGGGLEIRATGTDFLASGTQLFTGTTDTPTFTLGSFHLIDNSNGKKYELTISAVPEPATLALMLGGLGLVGYAASRRRAR